MTNHRLSAIRARTSLAPTICFKQCFLRGRLMSNKFSRCARLISLALVIASLCSAPLIAIVYGDNKSESKQDAKDGVKIELDASESSSAETSQPANADKNLLFATRPRLVSSRLAAPPAVEI